MGREYLGKFEDLCQQYQINHTTTAPYTPEENSICETYWTILMGTTRAMMYHAQLNYKLWPYAVKHSNYTLNRTLLTSINKELKTPYEWVYNEIPDLSKLRTWGCEAFSHVPQQFRTELEERSIKSYFVGIDNKTKHPVLYNKNISYNKGIYISRDVIFNEIIENRQDINTGNIIKTR